MNDLLCDKMYCHVVKEGLIIFADRQHLTEAFTVWVSSHLEARLAGILDR